LALFGYHNIYVADSDWLRSQTCLGALRTPALHAASPACLLGCKHQLPHTTRRLFDVHHSPCARYTQVRIGEFAVVPAQGSTALIAIPSIALAHPYSGLLLRASPMLSRFRQSSSSYLNSRVVASSMSQIVSSTMRKQVETETQCASAMSRTHHLTSEVPY
jgi:hypothetical protein